MFAILLAEKENHWGQAVAPGRVFPVNERRGIEFSCETIYGNSIDFALLPEEEVHAFWLAATGNESLERISHASGDSTYVLNGEVISFQEFERIHGFRELVPCADQEAQDLEAKGVWMSGECSSDSCFQNEGTFAL